MRLLVLDGAESIGGTKLYLESGSSAVLLDFGLNYKRWGLYFEEYLQPRAGRGLHDLLKLQIAPLYDGLYRDDLLPQNYKPDYYGRLAPQACLLSHAHLDHCGLVGLLRGDLPIYASPLSAAIMKAMQEMALTAFYGEMAYIVPRVPSAEEPRAIESSPYRAVAAQQRRWRLFSNTVTENLRDFLSAPPNPSPKARPWTPAPVEIATEKIGEMRLKVWPVDHSIPGACAFALETEAGWVVYTGDLRLHGSRGRETERFAQEAAKLSPELLIIEGTRAQDNNHESTSEQTVFAQALAAVRSAAGQLVIADFGPRNVERLLTFLQIAQETQRRLLVLTKDAYLLAALAAADSNFDLLGHAHLALFNDIKLDPKPWDAQMRERSKLIPIEDVQQNPGDFLLAFSFWDMKHLLDIEPAGGLYIYSSSEAHSEEQKIDMQRLFRWLNFFQLKAVGLALDAQGRSQVVGGLHASGHASGADLLQIARTIRPKRLLPVHTKHPEFFERESEFEILTCKDGQELIL